MKKLTAGALLATLFLLQCLPNPAKAAETETQKKYDLVNASCASHTPDCKVRLETRNGTLTLSSGPDEKVRLGFNRKVLGDFENYSVSVEDIVSVGKHDYFLILINSGGMACPVQWRILQANPDGSTKISGEFGSCSECYRTSVKRDLLTIRLPDYFNSMHLGDLTQRQRRQLAREKDHLYTWDGIRVRESRAAPAGKLCE